MKKILLFLMLTLLTVQLSYGQCDNPISDSIQFTNGTEVYVKYCGEIGNRGERSGYGILHYTDYEILYEEGYWKNGRLNGQAKTVFTDGDIYEGLYETGKLVEGKFSRVREKIKWTYEGGFDGFNFNGKGKETRESELEIVINEGSFFKDDLLKGTKIVKEKLSGVRIISKVEMGVETIIERNDINLYKKEDIIGDKEFIVVPLLRRGKDGAIAYDIELEINGVKGEWLLDTGAMGFTIGNIMFERLVKNGIKYKDLNKNVKSFGIVGVAYGNLVVIEELKIGDYILKNVVATVQENSSSSLLGTGFLSKFSNVEWNMQAETLKLFK